MPVENFLHGLGFFLAMKAMIIKRGHNIMRIFLLLALLYGILIGGEPDPEKLFLRKI
jgi:hypothetical protein